MNSTCIKVVIAFKKNKCMIYCLNFTNFHRCRPFVCSQCKTRQIDWLREYTSFGTAKKKFNKKTYSKHHILFFYKTFNFVGTSTILYQINNHFYRLKNLSLEFELLYNKLSKSKKLDKKIIKVWKKKFIKKTLSLSLWRIMHSYYF